MTDLRWRAARMTEDGLGLGLRDDPLRDDVEAAANQSDHDGDVLRHTLAARPPVTAVPRLGAGRNARIPRHSALRAGGAAREKKARRKNVKRRAREEEEIRLFRGQVSTVCTCMELDLERLLPALQSDTAWGERWDVSASEGEEVSAGTQYDNTNKRKHLDAKEREREREREQAGSSSNEEDRGGRVWWPDWFLSGAFTDSSGGDRRGRGPSVGQKASQQGNPAMISGIKGGWTFKPYLDVIHAMSSPQVLLEVLLEVLRWVSPRCYTSMLYTPCRRLRCC